MNLGSSLLLSGAAFLLFFAIFRPLEAVFPAKHQRLLRPGWWTDLSFMLGQYLVWNGLFFLFVDYVRGEVGEILPSGYLRLMASQPMWLRIVEAVVLSDFSIYWAHRLQHRFDFLWRFHAVHHSAEHLDWLATHREHPVDSVYSIIAINLPVILLGLPLEALAGLLAFRGLWAIFIHSNVRLPLGYFELLLGSPRLHHWHHDRDRTAGNYANLSPLMDLLFGTHHAPEGEPRKLGIRERMPTSYLGQLLHPFRRRD